jgi:RNA processing factor Prp31
VESYCSWGRGQRVSDDKSAVSGAQLTRCAMLVQNLATAEASRAQLGLAHSYSRAKVKFNVNRQDNMIIQARPHYCR